MYKLQVLINNKIVTSQKNNHSVKLINYPKLNNDILEECSDLVINDFNPDSATKKFALILLKP